MNLTKVTIHGFKRFHEKSTMNVDTKLISIVGANEAGKSSFLKALVHWNNDDKFSDTGGNQDLSRNEKIEPSQKIISCFLTLDEQDKKALDHIPEASKLNGFTVFKQADGDNAVCQLHPEISRDIDTRKELSKKVERAAANKKINFVERFQDIILNTNIEEYELEIDELDEVIEVLSSSDSTLNEKSIDKLRSMAFIVQKLIIKNDLKYIKELPELIESVIRNEVREDPEKEAINILFDSRPEFLLFNEQERMLKSEYQLGDENDFNDVALNNLFITAHLDKNPLLDAITSDDGGKVKEIIDLANQRLKEEFKVWRQSTVYPILMLDGHRLRILFGNLKTSGYDSIAERSDGLRQFIALFTFIVAGGSGKFRPKILLIDEAETHLHYDAQADFIQMLAKQELVTKVIYTTHSMGCLPEDLGNGIRFIQQDEDEKKSNIENWFWNKDDRRPGFSSILFGMGASTLAFIPVRHALFVEGAVDHILLPTIFKEAVDKDYLGFQVAPGISIASKDQIQIMDHESPKTAYLVDSDHGAKSLRRKLQRAKIPNNRVFFLPQKNKKGMAIEDLIDKKVYLDTINTVIRKYNDPKFQLNIKDIPDVDRAIAVDELCKSINAPLKRDVAYCLLDRKTEGINILSKLYKKKLADMVLKIENVFS